MSIEEAIQYLERLKKFSDEPQLHNINRMLDLFDHPERKMKYVHITGTNGKGSTSATVASIVQTAGYKVGLFTSPHLHRYNERIKMNGQDISDQDFVFYTEKLKKLLEKNPDIHPALFEALTFIAFLHFADSKVDLVVLEVGIGGRFDATNVIASSIAVITNIDLEHTQILGKTRAQIAFQKAGIMKLGCPVIIGEQDKKLQELFRLEAKKVGAILSFLQMKEVKNFEYKLPWQIFDFQDFKGLMTPLLGEHQRSNVSLAILAVKALRDFGFKITKKNIVEGAKSTHWPLRLECVAGHPDVILDAGHNLHGVRAICKTVKELFSDRDRILILGCSSDKPYKKMAHLLSGLADRIIVTQARYHGVDPKVLAAAISKKKTLYIKENPKEALQLARNLASKDTLILGFGGLYLAAELQEALNGDRPQSHQ